MASLFLVRGCLCLPKLCALKVMLHKPARRRSRNQFGNKLGGSLHEAKRGLVCALQLCKSQSGSRKGLYTYTLNEQLLTFPPAFLQSCQSTTPPSRRGGAFSARPLPSNNHRQHHHHEAGNGKRQQCQARRWTHAPKTSQDPAGESKPGVGWLDAAAVGVSLAVS